MGKTFVASVLAQYFNERSGRLPICADADPLTPTFSEYKALDVARIQITENGSVVQRKFDDLFEIIMQGIDPVVIDNGTATYMPILKFLKANDAYSLFSEHGKQVYMHVPIVGGDAKEMTLAGLENIIETVRGSNAKIIVYQNEFFGVPMVNGAEAAVMPLITNNSDIVLGVVKIIDRNSDDFHSDIRTLTEKKMTCAEAQSSSLFKSFARMRIRRVFADVYEQLDAVLGDTCEN